jgi:hypothetical protein
MVYRFFPGTVNDQSVFKIACQSEAIAGLIAGEVTVIAVEMVRV